jgi:hypothetical protein
MIQVLTPPGDDDTSSIRAVIAAHPSLSQRSVDLPTTVAAPQGPHHRGRTAAGRPHALRVKAIAEFPGVTNTSRKNFRKGTSQLSPFRTRPKNCPREMRVCFLSCHN